MSEDASQKSSVGGGMTAGVCLWPLSCLRPIYIDKHSGLRNCAPWNRWTKHTLWSIAAPPHWMHISDAFRSDPFEEKIWTSSSNCWVFSQERHQQKQNSLHTPNLRKMNGAGPENLPINRVLRGSIWACGNRRVFVLPGLFLAPGHWGKGVKRTPANKHTCAFTHVHAVTYMPAQKHRAQTPTRYIAHWPPPPGRPRQTYGPDLYAAPECTAQIRLVRLVWGEAPPQRVWLFHGGVTCSSSLTRVPNITGVVSK